MAKLSAYGRTEIGEIELLTKSFRYMSDGTILVNHGNGWKVYGKTENPAVEYAEVDNAQKAKLAEQPFYAAYRKELHSYGLSKRYKIHNMVKTFRNDPDGMFIENDESYDYDKPHLTREDCILLCKLFNQASMNKE